MKLWRDDFRPSPDSSWAWATGSSAAVQAIEGAIVRGEDVTEICIGTNDKVLVQYLAEDVPRALIAAEVVWLFAHDRVGAQRLKRILQRKGYPTLMQLHPSLAA